jgi:hypothetical protein
MTVPRKPEIMSGPCAMGNVGRSTGQPQPSRTNPAHIAASRATSPNAISGKGVTTRTDFIFDQPSQETCCIFWMKTLKVFETFRVWGSS